jgi:iron-sulfur cluster assembly accessory protein
LFEKDGAQLVIDGLSLEYVKGATVDFTVEMIGEAFEVKDNPNSEGDCGCGVSFSPSI